MIRFGSFTAILYLVVAGCIHQDPSISAPTTSPEPSGPAHFMFLNYTQDAASGPAVYAFNATMTRDGACSIEFHGQGGFPDNEVGLMLIAGFPDKGAGSTGGWMSYRAYSGHWGDVESRAVPGPEAAMLWIVNHNVYGFGSKAGTSYDFFFAAPGRSHDKYAGPISLSFRCTVPFTLQAWQGDQTVGYPMGGFSDGYGLSTPFVNMVDEQATFTLQGPISRVMAVHVRQSPDEPSLEFHAEGPNTKYDGVWTASEQEHIMDFWDEPGSFTIGDKFSGSNQPTLLVIGVSLEPIDLGPGCGC